MSRAKSKARRAKAKASRKSSSSSSSSSSGGSSSSESIAETLAKGQAVLDANPGNVSSGGSSSNLTAEQQANEDAAQLSRFGGGGSSSNGLVTSDSAGTAVDEARDTLNTVGSNTGATTTGGGSSELDGLFAQLSSLRTQLAETKAKEAAAGTPEVTDTPESTVVAEDGTTVEETDLSKSIDALNVTSQGGQADTSLITDPEARAKTEASINALNILEQQMTRASDLGKLMSEYSQADIDDINSTAMRSIKRQIAENARTQRAMEFAGVMSGRAQFSSRVEESLINNIIEDGLDRIDVINDKKNSAIRTARKAETEFNYKLFTESASLAKEYNQEIEDSITQLSADVRQADKDERDTLTFNQEQEERNALILAEELTEATPEQIAETAAANGIDVGLLTKAINDAKFESKNRSLTLEGQQASINSSNRANQKDEESNTLVGDFGKTDSAKLIAAGLENADIEDQRLFLNGGVDDRREILAKYGEKEPQTIEELDTLVKEKMDLFFTLGSDTLDDDLHTQAVAFGVASKAVGAQGDVRALLKHPALKGLIEGELETGTPIEDILDLLANPTVMSKILDEHKAK